MPAPSKLSTALEVWSRRNSSMHALRLCGTASPEVRPLLGGPLLLARLSYSSTSCPVLADPGRRAGTRSRGVARAAPAAGSPGWSAYALGRGARGQASRPTASPHLRLVSKLQAGARPESVSTWCPGALFPHKPASEPPEQRCERQEMQGGEQPREGWLWTPPKSDRRMEGPPTAIAPRVLTCTGVPGTDLRPCSTPAGPAPPRREPWCCPERREKEAS